MKMQGKNISDVQVALKFGVLIISAIAKAQEQLMIDIISQFIDTHLDFFEVACAFFARQSSAPGQSGNNRQIYL